VWEVDPATGVLTVLSLSESQALKVRDVISELVVEHIVALDTQNMHLIQSEKWKGLLHELTSVHGNVLQIQDLEQTRSVHIVAIATIMAGIKEKVLSFIGDNSVYEKVARVSKPVYRFLLMHAKMDLEKIDRMLSKNNGKLKYIDTERRIVFNGCMENINTGFLQLLTMSKGISSKKHTLSRAGIGKYMSSENGTKAIYEVENNVRCIIEKTVDSVENAIEEEDSPVFSHSLSVRLPVGITVKASCAIDSMRKMDVVLGDITEMNVDAIVNAANDRLDHVGGLAKAISEKGKNK
jgi:poly [ADP-ribose] polymerase 10/14/15